MKYFLLLVFSLLTFSAQAWDQWQPKPLENCKVQAPYGLPQSKTNGILICRHAYLTLNDPAAKIPVWVSYTLFPKNALGCVPRSNAFVADNSLPKGQRAELVDYAKSGFDIGHVAPNGDMSFDQQAELESFLLTNMMPQLPGLNRGIWKLLETSIRGWAVQRNTPMIVYTGSIYNLNDHRIGPNAVVVPKAFYKIVIDSQTNEVAGFLFPHQAGLGNDLTKVRAPVSQIQNQAGVVFAFPNNARELPANQIWPVDYGSLTNSKRAICKRVEE